MKSSEILRKAARRVEDGLDDFHHVTDPGLRAVLNGDVLPPCLAAEQPAPATTPPFVRGELMKTMNSYPHKEVSKLYGQVLKKMFYLSRQQFWRLPYRDRQQIRETAYDIVSALLNGHASRPQSDFDWEY
jgi:hypothetical protein